jgi:putative peptidoglycan lipid II flippase
VAVCRAWGPQASAGLGRSAVVAIGSGALWATAGRGLATVLHPDGLAAGGAVAVLVAIVVAALCAVSIWIADRESARLVIARLPRRAR